jgi:hypothetical protein
MDIVNQHLVWVAGASAVGSFIALIDDNRQRHTLAFEILESHVADIAVAAARGRCSRSRTTPSFNARAILSRYHGDILDENIGDDIFNAGILA